MKKKYKIEGMTCSACVLAVEKAVKKIDENLEVNVSLMTNTLDVKSDNEIDSSSIIKAVEKAGYKAISRTEKNEKRESPKEMMEKEAAKLKSRLKYSIPLMLILMYVAMGEMVGLPYPGFFQGVENSAIFIITQFLLTIPIIILNRVYFINGFKSLKNKSPNMDTLVALGSSAGIVYGIYTIYVIVYGLGHGYHELVHKYMHDIYFESSTMILTLITLGKFLEARSKVKTTDSINSLMEIQVDSVIKLVDGEEIEIAVEDLKKGDLIKIVPGDRIAVDGIIVEGKSSLDQSAITGESIPLELSVNDRVISGSVNLNGSFVLEATNVGEDTTISKIINLMEEASATKAPISRLADKVSGIFVPIVISLSLIAFIAWLALGKDIEFAFSIAIAVLVISCPCALGLATPVAMMVATGKAAENGILVKSQESLENLHKMDVMIFDKTGTITEGKPVVTDIIGINSFNAKKALKIAGSIEDKSQQPLADAIVGQARLEGVILDKIDDFKAYHGMGVSANFQGKKYFIGNTKLMDREGLAYADLLDLSDSYSKAGKTVVYLFDNENLLTIFAISDAIKKTSKKAIREIKDLGIKTVMLTGDNSLTAKSMAEEVGIDDFKSELLPQDKDKIVREYMKDNKVAMVGDGINDAPALMRADIGIAIADGTDIAIESADLVLMKSDLQDIVNSIKLSRRTLKIIKENLFWAFFYNVLSIPLAMGVFYPVFGLKLNPMIGAFAMSLSSIFVVTNSLRLNSFKIVKSNMSRDVDDVLIKKTSIQVNNKKEKLEKKGEKTMEKTIKIEGMSCGHCTGRVEKLLTELGGKDIKVSLEDKMATGEFSESITNEAIKGIIDDAGYEVKEIK